MRYKLGSIFIILIFFTTTVFAASDDFIVKLVITGSDIVPPTTPSNLIATVVGSSQIDIAWDVSTDDVLLSGYKVFRDSVQIATTTLTTYSDTGLISSTSYTYYVQAFDSSSNISTSSNTSSATTPSQSPTDSSGVGLINKVNLLSLNVESGIYGVEMQWITNQYSKYELRWGRTTSYELGFVANEVFSREHQTSITGLETGTIYEYELLAYNRRGDVSVLSRSQFQTLDAEDIVPPANVSDFNSEVDGKNVKLTWKNPEDIDFSYVRIVRSYLFYPTDPSDGYIVYQGNNSSVTDKDSFTQETALYYTAFSYDETGNVSSGALLNIRSATGISNNDVVVTDTGLFDVGIDDVIFVQNGEYIKAIDNSFFIDTNKSFTVRVPYLLLPERLKAIYVKFSHPIDESLSFSFLLRVNKDKTAYEATVAPLSLPGSFPVTFSIYDFNTQKLFEFNGEIIAQTQEVELVNVLSIKNGGMKIIFPFLFILLLLVFWFFSFKKNRQRNSITE